MSLTADAGYPTMQSCCSSSSCSGAIRRVLLPLVDSDSYACPSEHLFDDVTHVHAAARSSSRSTETVQPQPIRGMASRVNHTAFMCPAIESRANRSVVYVGLSE